MRRVICNLLANQAEQPWLCLYMQLPFSLFSSSSSSLLVFRAYFITMPPLPSEKNPPPEVELIYIHESDRVLRALASELIEKVEQIQARIEEIDTILLPPALKNGRISLRRHEKLFRERYALERVVEEMMNDLVKSVMGKLERHEEKKINSPSNLLRSQCRAV